MNDKSIDINSSNQSPFFATHMAEIRNMLSAKQNLVQERDVYELKTLLQQAYEKPNENFILHIGDCAESFDDCTEETVFNKCKFYTDTAKLLADRLQKKVVIIGRIAGQYAKPRTEDFEQYNGIVLPIYRGDMINSYEFDTNARKPNSERILKAYDCSSRTIDFINAYEQKYGGKIFTSHEALVLDYERGLTRHCRHSMRSTGLFNSSAHTVWLGDRSRNMSHSHIEYLATIHNPVGVKIGATQSPETLIDLLNALNPSREDGKLYLITRLGVANVQEKLSKLIEAVKAAAFPVLWCVDPMHGNTFKVNQEKKVRTTYDILDEVLYTIKIHKEMGTHLSGLHLEATFLPVTECVTKRREDTTICDLPFYTTKCDPRLNAEQVRRLIKQILLK